MFFAQEAPGDIFCKGKKTKKKSHTNRLTLFVIAATEMHSDRHECT